MQIAEEGIGSAMKQNCFKLIPENQLVLYVNQPNVFISGLQKHRSNSFKAVRDREIHTQCLYWFTLNLSYIQSLETFWYSIR